MGDKPSFEIPPELRDMAEKNVEQARVAYGQFMDFLTQAMGAWAKSTGNAEMGGFNAQMGGFKAVQERAIGFAKENAERSFALASDLARKMSRRCSPSRAATRKLRCKHLAFRPNSLAG